MNWGTRGNEGLVQPNPPEARRLRHLRAVIEEHLRVPIGSCAVGSRHRQIRPGIAVEIAHRQRGRIRHLQTQGQRSDRGAAVFRRDCKATIGLLR